MTIVFYILIFGGVLFAAYWLENSLNGINEKLDDILTRLDGNNLEEDEELVPASEMLEAWRAAGRPPIGEFEKKWKQQK